MSHQIDHILIHPHGVFVIETKNYYGEISTVPGESFWIKNINGKKERIFNPLKQNKNHVKIINKILEKKYEVVSLVVFAKNNAPYLADENVINLEDLLLFIESYPYKELLSKEKIDGICTILKSKSCELSKPPRRPLPSRAGLPFGSYRSPREASRPLPHRGPQT